VLLSGFDLGFHPSPEVPVGLAGFVFIILHLRQGRHLVTLRFCYEYNDK
jgi:hypothetical protein